MVPAERERKVSSPGSSPRGGEGARAGSEVKEKTTACSGVPSSDEKLVGGHGDDGGGFLGSEVRRPAREPRRRKEGRVRESSRRRALQAKNGEERGSVAPARAARLHRLPKLNLPLSWSRELEKMLGFVGEGRGARARTWSRNGSRDPI